MRNVAISLRARAEQCELIDKVASLLGKNRSDFMLKAACEKVQDVIFDQIFFQLDHKKFQQLYHMPDAPVRQKQGLERLLTVKAPWVKAWVNVLPEVNQRADDGHYQHLDRILRLSDSFRLGIRSSFRLISHEAGEGAEKLCLKI